MNLQALEHISESNYCFAISKNRIRIRLRVSREDEISGVNILYGCKYDFQNQRTTKKMELRYKTELFSYYEATLNLKDMRLVYVFEIYEKGHRYYFSENGLTSNYNFETSFYDCFQYSYINPNDIVYPIEWLKTATFYQIFVDRFNIGDNNKDKSYIDLKWGDIPTSKSFAGGDLKGIINKLDYIKNLGINALYLTPIFKSKSNHKYDISNYYEIDPQFGDKQDLKTLVDEAHSKNIKIVLDAVFNHCSEDLEQFQDVLRNKQKSKYYDWFVIKKSKEFEYETFAHCDYMPKFNTANIEVQDYLINVALYYINEFDIDGLRLDVSDEVSHEFWKKFRRKVKRAKPSCAIIGENWHSAASFLNDSEFDSIMNYGFTKACLDFYATNTYDAEGMANKLNSLLMRNYDATNIMMLNLLDSHDTFRFLTEVKSNKNKLRNALSLLYFYVGVPCIYYGTEINMIGGYDPDSRRTFDWSYKDSETKEIIKSLAKLKTKGLFSSSEITIKQENNLLILERYNADESLRLVINNTNESVIYYSENPVVSNLFCKNTLEQDGFLIEKII